MSPREDADASRIYREAALSRLSSPDQLDQLMEVTTPRGWLAVTVLAGILALTLAWGFFGSIPSKVAGTGILIRTGGVADVASESGGMVDEVEVAEGDTVTPGQVVARLRQADLQERIGDARAALAEARLQHERRQAFAEENTRLLLEQLERERGALSTRIDAATERLDHLEERIQSQERLVERGLITRQTLLATRDQHAAARSELDQARNQLQQIEVRELEIRNREEQERMTSRFRVNEAERALTALEEQRERTTEVTSTFAGRVVEVMASPGDVVQPTEPVLNLEVAEEEAGGESELTAVIYMPMTEGKRVAPGMTVQISPTSVQREEHGFMTGTVEYASAFPATYQGMMRVLANDQLVRTLSAGGAPIAVYARLHRDPDSPTGFRWSSGDGPETSITSGTMAGVSVVVDERRPIEMVIPFVRRKLGMGSQTGQTE